MLKFYEGFDAFANKADLQENGWSDVNDNMTVAAVGRNGGRALTGNGAYALIGFPAINEECVIGFAYYCEAFLNEYGLAPEILRIKYGGLNQFGLLGNSAGGLILSYAGFLNRVRLGDGGPAMGSTASSVLALFGWTFIELKFSIGSSANLDLYLNGDPTPALTITGVDNDYAATGSFNGIELCTNGAATAIDDVYVLTTSGGTYTARLGDVSSRIHKPNADGVSSMWTPSTGIDHYATIDDVPPDETSDDYNEGALVNDFDLVGVENLVTTGYNILAVQPVAHAKKTDTGVAGMKMMTRTGAPANYTDSTENFLMSGYRFVRGDVQEVSPAGGQWTETNFNNAQFGYKKST